MPLGHTTIGISPGKTLNFSIENLAAGIGLGIEPLMRVTVAGEEVLEPQHIAVVGPADDDRTARTGFQEAHAAQDQRAHDALAELGLGDEQRAQLRRRDDDDVDRLARDGVDQGRTAAKLRQLTHETAGLVGHDQ